MSFFSIYTVLLFNYITKWTIFYTSSSALLLPRAVMKTLRGIWCIIKSILDIWPYARERVLMPRSDKPLLSQSMSHDGSLGTQVCAVAWNLICWLDLDWRSHGECWCHPQPDYTGATVYISTFCSVICFLFAVRHFHFILVHYIKGIINTGVKSSFNYCANESIYRFPFVRTLDLNWLK